MGSKNKCVVCGKVFPEGQGIVLNVGDETLYFHSKRCAIKFFKNLVEELNPEELRKAINEVKRTFDDMLKKKAEVAQKKI